MGKRRVCPNLQDGGDLRLFDFCGGKQFEALLSAAGNLTLVSFPGELRLNSVLHDKSIADRDAPIVIHHMKYVVHQAGFTTLDFTSQ